MSRINPANRLTTQWGMVGINETFNTVDDLITHVTEHGCDPNNNLTKNGEEQDETVWSLMMEEEYDGSDD